MKKILKRGTQVFRTQVHRHPVAEWAVTLVLLLFGTTSLVQAFVIPTGSMENTLLVGDHLLVDKLVYAPAGKISSKVLPYSDVKRGDIIVFRFPPDISQNLVKRVIGVPGDHIRIRAKHLVLNHHEPWEPYVVHTRNYIEDYPDNFPVQRISGLEPKALSLLNSMLDHHVQNGEVVVPPGSYFAMGDNRDNSSDSRYWGFVPPENITGKPLIVYWSYDAPTEALSAPGIGADHLVDLATHFFSKTRWQRSFRLVHGYPLN